MVQTGPRSLSAMLEQMQRDLFALGRGWRIPLTGSPAASPRPRSPLTTSPGSKAGSTTLETELPPLRRFILPEGLAGRRRPARRAHRLPPGRARDGGTRRRRAELLVYINRVSDLLFVMARAANHRERHAGNRVVDPPVPRLHRPTRSARSSPATTTRTFRSPPSCCRGGCVRHIAAIYAFARTADDFADEPGRDPAERSAAGRLPRQLHAAVRDIVQRGDARTRRGPTHQRLHQDRRC